MRQLVRPALSLALFVAVSMGVAQDGKPHTYVPPKGYVPDAKTALAVGRAVLTPVYGEEKLAHEEPFRASLQDDTWIVVGTLAGSAKGVRGGVAEVWISKRTGAILRMTHGK